MHRCAVLVPDSVNMYKATDVIYAGDVDVFTVEVYSVCCRDVFTFFFMFTFVSLLS